MRWVKTPDAPFTASFFHQRFFTTSFIQATFYMRGPALCYHLLITRDWHLLFLQNMSPPGPENCACVSMFYHKRNTLQYWSNPWDHFMRGSCYNLAEYHLTLVESCFLPYPLMHCHHNPFKWLYTMVQLTSQIRCDWLMLELPTLWGGGRYNAIFLSSSSTSYLLFADQTICHSKHCLLCFFLLITSL